MTVAQLNETLQIIPADVQNSKIMVQTETKGHGFTASFLQVYMVKQSQYTSEGGDIINQETYDLV